jgi:nicotinamidase/pyrazinamidase
MATALILVDIQYDFCPGGALAVPEGDRVVLVANAVQPAFDLVVATQDWHPPNHGSFAANHPGHKPGDVIDLHGLPQILWPVHCVQDTHGAELHRDLDTSRVAFVARKGIDPDIDSYSTFYDNGHRRSTGLAEFLRGRGVGAAAIMGLATDYCVLWSVLDAVKEEFRMSVIVDGCRGIDLVPGDVDRAFEQMRAAGAELTDSRRVIESR